MDAIDLIKHWCSEQGYEVRSEGPYTIWAPSIAGAIPIQECIGHSTLTIERKIVLRFIGGELKFISFCKRIGYALSKNYPVSLTNPRFLDELKLLVDNVAL